MTKQFHLRPDVSQSCITTPCQSDSGNDSNGDGTPHFLWLSLGKLVMIRIFSGRTSFLLKNIFIWIYSLKICEEKISDMVFSFYFFLLYSFFFTLYFHSFYKIIFFFLRLIISCYEKEDLIILYFYKGNSFKRLFWNVVFRGQMFK